MFEKVLKELGVDSKHITEIAKAVKDGKDDLDIAPIIEAYKSSQRKLMENDEDLVKGIAGKERAKILDQVERKVKQKFNLSPEQLKVITIDPEKPLNRVYEIIDLSHTEMSNHLGKDLQTVQQENVDLVSKLKTLEDVEIPKIRQESQDHIKKFNIKNKLSKKIPVSDLRVPHETVDLVLNSQIAALYDIDEDEKGEILIFNKGSKLQAKSSDGTKLLTAEDVINDILKKNQFVKESNADDAREEEKKKIIQPAGQEPAKPAANAPHLGEAEKHLQRLKDERLKREAEKGVKI